MTMLEHRPTKVHWVRETRFGRWFLTTNTWFRYVLSVAVVDFKTMLRNRVSTQKKILDAGCGGGLAFSLLELHFQPKTIIGVDIDQAQISLAKEYAKKCSCKVELVSGTVADLEFANDSIDVIFCHQVIHHVAHQTEVLREFYRILAPGGVILLGESCKSFVNSFLVRLLFRHPMQQHKSAEEYVELVKSVGFKVSENDIQTSVPWWSRADFGITGKLGLPQRNKDATEVLIVATKP